MIINHNTIIAKLNRIKEKNFHGKKRGRLLLTVKEIKKIAEKFRYSSKEVEIIALNEGLLPSRY